MVQRVRRPLLAQTPLPATFATYLLAGTKNLRRVKKQLRHSSPSVTAVYADVIPEGVSEAMERMRD